MEAGVVFLLENLKDLVVYHTNLIKGAEGELEELKKELVKLQIILEEAPVKYVKNKLFEEWMRNMREAVYDIEDAIDTCITRATAERSRTKIKWLKNIRSGAEAISLAEQIKNLRQTKVKPLMEEFYASKFSIDDHDAPDAQPDPMTDHANFLRQPQVLISSFISLFFLRRSVSVIVHKS